MARPGKHRGCLLCKPHKMGGNHKGVVKEKYALLDDPVALASCLLDEDIEDVRRVSGDK